MKNLSSTTQGLSAGQFWRWATAHYNCIVRAGNASVVIFDQPYLHWHLLQDDDGLLVAQVLRGKDLIAELVVDQNDVLYVEATPQEDDQVLFELIGEASDSSGTLCHFLMTHGYEEDEETPRRGWTH